MIECLQLSKGYSEAGDLFDGGTFRVAKGEIAILSGPAGSGKSTLLRMLLGMDRPDEGQVRLQGKNVHEMPQRRLWKIRRRMGIVFQKDDLVPHWSVYENVAIPLVVSGRDRSIIRKRVFQTLERLGLHRKAGLRCAGLGAAERKLTEFARAAVNSPLTFIVDEPLCWLEPDDGSRVMDLLRELTVEGSTLLMLAREPSRLTGIGGARWLQIVHRRFDECRTAG